MSTAMRAYIVISSATVIVPWILTEVTHALGIPRRMSSNEDIREMSSNEDMGSAPLGVRR